MKTNRDKWNYYKEILKKRDQDFIKSVIGDKLPEVFYTVESAFNTTDYYRVGVNTVEYAMYWYDEKPPTNAAIDSLKAYAENEISYLADRIRLFWRRGDTSGAISWTDFVEKKHIYDNLADAQVVADAKRKQYIEEKAQLEAGTHKKCCYCGAVRLIADIHHDQIYSPNWRATGGKSPPRPYCKDKGCAGYDQMAHEG